MISSIRAPELRFSAQVILVGLWAAFSSPQALAASSEPCEAVHADHAPLTLDEAEAAVEKTCQKISEGITTISVEAKYGKKTTRFEKTYDLSGAQLVPELEFSKTVSTLGFTQSKGMLADLHFDNAAHVLKAGFNFDRNKSEELKTKYGDACITGVSGVLKSQIIGTRPAHVSYYGTLNVTFTKHDGTTSVEKIKLQADRDRTGR